MLLKELASKFDIITRDNIDVYSLDKNENDYMWCGALGLMYDKFLEDSSFKATMNLHVKKIELLGVKDSHIGIYVY